MAEPRLTVSLVTFNGAAWLPGCLAALDAQAMNDFEVLLLDNASHDDTRSILRVWAQERPGTQLQLSDRNLGYAAAHNRNIAAARGELVLLLNQDVELDAGFLTAIVAASDAHPDAGAFQARLRSLDGPAVRMATLDSTGLEMGRDRRAVSRDQGLVDGPDTAVAGPVWGADGPAPVYRRIALRDARLPRGDGSWEVLDEDFFLYKEDVDLSWRLGLLGWSSWYEPAALGWHARGTGGTGATSLLAIARTNRSISRVAKELSWRNQRLMQIKNEDVRSYVRDLPWIGRRELLSLAFITLFDPLRLRAIPALLRAAPNAMRKRRYLRAQLRRRSRRSGRSHKVVRSRRRRIYDRLPGALRRPVGAAYESLLDVGRRVCRLGAAPRLGQVLGPQDATETSGTILFVDDQVPEPDVHAGALTTYHYLRILREAGFRVIFRPNDGLRREPYASDLEACGIHLIGEEADLADWLVVNGSAVDHVLLSRPVVARRHVRSVRKHSDARVSYLDHDLHFLRERRRFEASGDPQASSESRRLLEIETDIFRAVDAVLTFSPDEVTEIERLAPGADVCVVTPAFYAVTRERTTAAATTRTAMLDRHDVVFVGAYDHLPNVDAAETLVREIMPLVWAEQPDTQVWLLGGHVPESVASLASKRVHVTGHVPTLDPYWDRARVALLPLRFGSGVKGKVIASLEAGVPVVTTSIGNEGIGLVPGREALIADNAQALAANVVELLRDAALAESLARAGGLVLEARFSEDRVRADLLTALHLPEPSASNGAPARPGRLP